MRTVRTAIVTISPILRDILVDAARSTLQLDIVAEFASSDQLLLGLATVSPDLVVIQQSSGEMGAVVRDILALAPHCRVITLAIEHDRFYIHEMRPVRRVVVNASLRVLLRAMQRAGPAAKT